MGKRDFLRVTDDYYHDLNDPLKKRTFARYLERIRRFEKHGPDPKPTYEEHKAADTIEAYRDIFERCTQPNKSDVKRCKRVLKLLISQDRKERKEAIEIINKEIKGTTALTLGLVNVEGKDRVLAANRGGGFREDFFCHVGLFLYLHEGLNKLRQCKECQGFFVLERGDHRYCDEECRKAAYDQTVERRKKHAETMRKYRERKKKEQGRADGEMQNFL